MKAGFPRFLGGHLTRFRQSKGVMIESQRHWYNRIVTALREFNAALPQNARADHGALPASWREKHELVIGVVEEYKQLVDIAPPVTQLTDECPTTQDGEERRAVTRHQLYFVENFNRLVTY